MNQITEEPLRTLVQRLTDLVAIQSFSGQEQGVSEYIVQDLAPSGAVIEVDGNHNVAAILAPSRHKATLHIAGHMDTVPPGAGWDSDPLAPLVQDDRVIGLGSSDMKAGLAGMMTCLESLSRKPLHNLRTIFGFTICEEGPVPGKRNGVNDLCERYGGDYAITAEASGAGHGIHFPSVGSQAHLRIAVTFPAAPVTAPIPRRASTPLRRPASSSSGSPPITTSSAAAGSSSGMIRPT